MHCQRPDPSRPEKTLNMSKIATPENGLSSFRQTRFEPGSDESRHVGSALSKARLNWGTKLKPVLFEGGEFGVSELADRFVVVRDDTNEPLDVVGSSFTDVRNDAAMGPIQPLLDSGEARLISAGYTGNGRHVYVQAELTGSNVEITRGDSMLTTINFATGHDGTLQTSAGFSRARVVCWNTMQAMIKSLAWRSRHTSGTHDRLREFALELHAQRQANEEAADLFRQLTRKKLNDRALTAYVREVLSPGAGSDAERVVRNVDRIVELANDAPGATPGTMWGGLNAVTYWATHERGNSENSRQDALLFGQGGQLIERASAVAFQLAEHLPSNEMGRAASQAHATAGLEFGALLGRRSAVLDQADAE